jgi:hypothetical protein
MRHYLRRGFRLIGRALSVTLRVTPALLLFTLLLLMPASPLAATPQPPPLRDRTRPAPEEALPTVLHTERLPGGLRTTTVQIPVAADAYIASERPTYNFGDDALFLGYNLEGDAFGAERVLLRFNVLSAVPPGVVVNDAQLRLTVSYVDPVGDPPMGTFVRRAASQWEEYTVTWQREPTWGDIYASADVGAVGSDVAWDVTDLVGGWVAGTYANFGVIIIGDERVQQRERAFYARESTGPSAYLVVTFTADDDQEPPVVTVDDLPDYSPRQFEVTWSGTDPGGSGIHHYDVQYSIDGGAWADWITNIDFTHAVYTGQDGRLYQFRARGVDYAGNVEAYGDVEAGTLVDVSPPTSEVQPLPLFVRDSDSFEVTWTGSDTASGIQSYDVRYRVHDGPWISWKTETAATQATFTATADGRYAFEVRARDHRGLVEDFTGEAEAFTVLDIYGSSVTPRVWLPYVPRAH